MERITKASINGISFAMSDEAFHIIDARLSELNRLCNGKDMSQYEKKIADFLIEKGCRDNVVNAETARQSVENAGGPKESRESKNGDRKRSNGCLKGCLTAILIILCFPLVICALLFAVVILGAIFGFSVAGLTGATGIFAGLFSLSSMAGGIWIRLFILLLAMLPIICLIWALVILFSRNRKGKWKPLMIIFLVWLVAAILVFCLSANKVSLVQERISTITRAEDRISTIKGDTLFVRMDTISREDNDGMLVYGDRNNFVLTYAPRCENRRMKLGDLSQAIVYPTIKLGHRWDLHDEVALKVSEVRVLHEQKSANEKEFLKSLNSSRENVCYHVEGDTIVIFPKFEKFDDGFRLPTLDVDVPFDLKVKVLGPVPHDFEEDMSFQNILPKTLNIERLKSDLHRISDLF